MRSQQEAIENAAAITLLQITRVRLGFHFFIYNLINIIWQKIVLIKFQPISTAYFYKYCMSRGKETCNYNISSILYIVHVNILNHWVLCNLTCTIYMYQEIMIFFFSWLKRVPWILNSYFLRNVNTDLYILYRIV